MRPSGWNEFQNAPGEYDVKWEDLVERTELAMVGSNPVKTATSVEALGGIDTVLPSNVAGWLVGELDLTAACLAIPGVLRRRPAPPPERPVP